MKRHMNDSWLQAIAHRILRVHSAPMVTHDTKGRTSFGRLAVSFAVLWTTLTFAGPPIEYRVSDIKNPHRNWRCGDFLISVIHGALTRGNVVNPNQVLSYVATVEGLPELLTHANIPNEHIAEVLRMFQSLETTPLSPILSDVVVRLRSPNTRDRLFLSVLPLGGSLPDGDDAHYYPLAHNFDTVRQFGNQRYQLPDPNRTHLQGIARHLNVILIHFNEAYRSEVRALSFVAAFYHEARHFFDYDFLSNWIQANRYLIKNGKTADALYRRFVRSVNISGQETTLMLSGFHSAYLESRGNRVTSAIFQHFLDPQMFTRMDAQVRENVLRDIRDMGGSSIIRNPPLRANNQEHLTAENIFDFGQRWHDEMQRTIEQAGLAAMNQPTGSN